MYGLSCPCPPSSATHFAKERLGLTVFTVPRHLLPTWEEEFVKCGPTTPDGTAIRLLFCHRDATVFRDRLQDNLSLARGFDRTQKFVRVEPNTPGSGGKALERVTWSKYRVEGRLANGLVIILTTTGSMRGQFLEKLHRHEVWYEIPALTPNKAKGKQGKWVQSKTKTRKSSWPSCVVSYHFKDEAHLMKEQNVNNINLIKANNTLVNYTLPLSIISMTGTPLYTGPADMVPLLKPMIRDEWLTDPVLKDFTPSMLDGLVTKWNRGLNALSRANDMDTLTEVVEALKPICGALMLSVSHEDKFLGRQLVCRVPILEITQLTCEHQPDEAAHVNSLRATLKSKYDQQVAIAKAEFEARNPLGKYTPPSFGNRFFRERICASFPALDLICTHTGAGLGLTETEWIYRTNARECPMARRWIESDALRNPYRKNIATIVTSTGKTAPLETIYDRFEHRVDADGLPAQGIFGSSYFATTAVIYNVSSTISWVEDRAP
jgi:hypothetical protein